jgi:hypothetical protein
LLNDQRKGEGKDAPLERRYGMFEIQVDSRPAANRQNDSRVYGMRILLIQTAKRQSGGKTRHA